MSKKAHTPAEPPKVRLVYILHKGEGPEKKELVIHGGGGRPYGLKISPYDRELGGEPRPDQIAEVPDPEVAARLVNACSQLHFLHDDDLKLCFPNSSKKMRSPLIQAIKPEDLAEVQGVERPLPEVPITEAQAEEVIHPAGAEVPALEPETPNDQVATAVGPSPNTETEPAPAPAPPAAPEPKHKPEAKPKVHRKTKAEKEAEAAEALAKLEAANAPTKTEEK